MKTDKSGWLSIKIKMDEWWVKSQEWQHIMTLHMSERTHLSWRCSFLHIYFMSLLFLYSPSHSSSWPSLSSFSLTWTYLRWNWTELAVKSDRKWNWTEKEPVFCSFLDCRRAAASPRKLEIRTKLASERSWHKDFRILFIQSQICTNPSHGMYPWPV